MAGSTESITYLARGLARRGHAVHLACPRDVGYWERLRDDPVSLHEISFAWKWHPGSVRRLSALVRRERIQIVNAQAGYDRYVGMLAQIFAPFPAKVVHTRRQRVNSSGGALQRAWYLQATDGLVAVSEGVKRSMLRKGYPPERITVIPNGTPPEKYRQWSPGRTEALRHAYGIGPADFVVGCVARPKRQDQLLEALARLPFRARAVFLGMTEAEAAQRFGPALEKARQAGIEPLWLGRQPQAEVLAWLGLMHVKVLPSVIEGLSQSLLEAMAMGVPCVATDASGNPDLIAPERNGLLFPDGDIAALATCLERLQASPALRQQLIEAGRQTALVDFSIERTLDRYEDFYYQLLNLNR